ncbi:MAG: amino acid permease [Gammaproteobacteria bacterium]|nr:amino acid permease [Gammaproteobacteria bacterium]
MSNVSTKPKLGFFSLLSISLGQIIGAGVVIMTGIGIDITGYGTPWAFVLALVIVALPSICIAALGSAIPATGGTYTYVRDLLGHKTSFLYLALLVAGQLVLANYAIGFAEYASAVVNGINMTLVAALMMTFSYVINLFGIQVAARFQTVMVVSLLVSLLLFIGFGIQQIDNFEVYTQPEKIMPNGIPGFIAAAYILRFSMIGSEFVSELGGDTKNPERLIPIVMGCSLITVTLLYIAISIVATGALPLEQVQGETLALVAKSIFPPAVYVFFIVGGVMLALLTSLNSIFAWCTKGIYTATKDGWLPEKLASVNRFGTPWIFLTLFFLVGIFPILSGMTMKYIAILGNSVGIIFGIIPVIALYNLKERKPHSYANAKFKLSPLMIKVFPVIATIIYSYGVYTSLDFIGRTGVITLLVYTALVIVYAFWREPHVISKKAS